MDGGGRQWCVCAWGGAGREKVSWIVENERFFFYEDAVSQSLPDAFQLLLSPRPADVYFSLWGRKTKRG